MLDAFIIEWLKEEKKERPQLELPLPCPKPYEPNPNKPNPNKPNCDDRLDRGVVIIYNDEKDVARPYSP